MKIKKTTTVFLYLLVFVLNSCTCYDNNNNFIFLRVDSVEQNKAVKSIHSINKYQVKEITLFNAYKNDKKIFLSSEDEIEIFCNSLNHIVDTIKKDVDFEVYNEYNIEIRKNDSSIIKFFLYTSNKGVYTGMFSHCWDCKTPQKTKRLN